MYFQKTSTASLLLILITFWLAAPLAYCAEAATQSEPTSVSLPTSTPVEGLAYEHRSWRDGDDGPWSAHILKIERDRSDFAYVSTLAQSTVFGLSPVSSQVKSVMDKGEPLAAINGDFFVIKLGPYRGDPIGLQVTDGELVSGSTRPAFWIDSDGQPRIGDVRTEIKVDLNLGEPFGVGLNRERGDNEAVLYTAALGDSTRAMGGRELVLDLGGQTDDEPAVGEEWLTRVKSISTEGNTPIQDGEAVLSLGPVLAEKYAVLDPGDEIYIKFSSDPDLEGVEAAIGGGPILITGGQIVVDDDKVRHPRTAVGMNDESIFWVAVDGRQPGLSVGVSLPELAALMLDLGCTEALNLDGGGSTTLWLEGQVMNSPSDGRERSVANALVLIRKAISDIEATAASESKE